MPECVVGLIISEIAGNRGRAMLRAYTIGIRRGSEFVEEMPESSMGDASGLGCRNRCRAMLRSSVLQDRCSCKRVITWAIVFFLFYVEINAFQGMSPMKSAITVKNYFVVLI